jgi:hypothetical protein
MNGRQSSIKGIHRNYLRMRIQSPIVRLGVLSKGGVVSLITSS